jgi:hypothetical protein
MAKSSSSPEPQEKRKRYIEPVLTPEKLRAVKRGDFDFLMPFQTKNLLRTGEVAAVIGRSPQFVRELVEQGKLEAHVSSAYGEGIRESPLITRRSVILYLAETANYDTSFLVIRIEVLFKGLNAFALNRLITTAQTLLSRIN